VFGFGQRPDVGGEVEVGGAVGGVEAGDAGADVVVGERRGRVDGSGEESLA
jgi:hypothetical protein